ncbi:MAG: beta-lactamase family protein [Myxococcales bacterium]|nr:beta-lactamase family protein [Myxococcales bacterium]
MGFRNYDVSVTNIKRKRNPRFNTRPWLLVAAVALTPFGCGQLTVKEINARLAASLADAVTEDEEVKSAALLVDAPRLGLSVQLAVGVAHEATGTAMTTETPFLSASIGKLFVATAVMKLVADGRLSLDDPLTKWVPLSSITGLPVVGGDRALGRITVQMLLTHRSGLPDYFSGKPRAGAERLFDVMAKQPGTTWTRTALLDYARQHYDPVGAPGTIFAYADTNYDLLGMVLEGVVAGGAHAIAAGAPPTFHQVVRQEVLTPLALGSTWYHAFETAPPGLPTTADVFIKSVNMTGASSLSADQAGGGLVTTLGDLGRFIRALVEGRPVPLSTMATAYTKDAMHAGIDVGLCAWRIRPRGIFFALGGLPDLVGHSGATGAFAYYAAEHDAVIVGTFNQTTWQENHVKFLLSDVLPVLARARRS